MDIRLEQSFINDYDRLPVPAQKVIDRYVRVVVQTGWFPRNANAHQMRGLEEEVWTAYITRTKEHFRLLFYKGDDILTFHRVLKHDKRDVWLKT